MNGSSMIDPMYKWFLPHRNQQQLQSTGTVWQDANLFASMPKSEEL